MLQTIRDNSRGIFAKIFIAFVIAVFALFGVESIIGTFLSENTVVRVNDVELSETQIENAVQRRIQQMVTDMSDEELANLDEQEVRRQTIDELIQRELLTQEAQASGLTVSSAAIDRQIANTEDFQVNGTFDNNRAQAVLMSAGFTPASYREAIRQEGLLDQLINGYTGTVFVTESEFEQLAALAGQTRDFRYLLVDVGSEAMNLEITDEEIATYYEQNQERFMQEERVSVNYVELDRESIRESIEITEEEIVERYELEQRESAERVERRASHILLEAADEAALEQAREQAAELKSRLDNGESFEELAAEYSDDAGSADFGGDVGYTTGDSFVPAFETALSALEVGEVSGPAQTEFGIHLIKLTELNQEETESLEDARERIREQLVSERAETRYTARAEQLNTLAFESFDLQAPAEALDLEIRQTELFSRRGGTGVASEQAFIDAAFSPEVLEDDLNSELVGLGDGRSVVLHLAEYEPASVQPLEEVRSLIQVTLRAEKVREMARERGEDILATLRNDGNITTLLSEMGLQWNRVADLTRDSQSINPELRNWVFTMPEPEENDGSTLAGRSLSNGTYAIVELQAVTPGSLDDLEEQEAMSLRNFLAQQAATDLFTALLAKLENEAEIER